MTSHTLTLDEHKNMGTIMLDYGWRIEIDGVWYKQRDVESYNNEQVRDLLTIIRNRAQDATTMTISNMLEIILIKRTLAQTRATN